MKKFRLNIDGREVQANPGQTILEVAQENNIFIPTFCYDERTEIYGSCGLCVCEVEGNPKLVKACATEIAPNMVILTNTPRVMESRKTNLELILSNHTGDCVGPCSLACPAGTDCQGYVGLVANGDLESAIKLIRERIPLPASIGRVCPHPCEDKCRRKLIDGENGALSIQWIKMFAADRDLETDNPYMPEVAAASGKKVAIVGGGPMGLAAAYFLAQKGHAVTIYEAMPKLGGMIRYGIPEYRLPKEVLDAEISLIEKMGVKLVTNTKVGTDISFDTIKEEHDAVLLGIGAWLSTGVGCPGEDLPGVIGGIDFLRHVVRNEEIKLGDKVAIVGGGNTAMDACRTAVRLGASKVYNIYRRTKDEMPADRIEIIEGEEEGVIFLNLTNPLEIVAGPDGRVSKMVLQVMELGEPDSSGRRAPRAVEGKTETIEVDTVILAIGQAVNPEGLEDVGKTRKGGIAYDPETFMTNVEGIFAGGDCGNDKISIAVEAIADAQKASVIIDRYLGGEKIKYTPPYQVVRTDITEKTFEDRERICRPQMGHLSPQERKDNFAEIIFGYTPEQAAADASRCLECGCHDFFECKLIKFANDYEVKPARFSGDKTTVEFEDDHPFINRDPGKCILCGLCVRVCDEVIGAGALGLVNRGFDTVVKPTLERPLLESGCISCGQCVSVCPTGALQERLNFKKAVPLPTEVTETTCAYCSVGCSLLIETHGQVLVKSNPDKAGVVNEGLCCGKGKWGFNAAVLPDNENDVRTPLIAEDGKFRQTSLSEAVMYTAKKAQSIAAKYGKDSVAVAISDRLTNEEAFVVKKLADVLGAKTLCFNNRPSGLAPVLGVDASPNTIGELQTSEVILVSGFKASLSPVVLIKLRQAAQNGAKILVLNPGGYEDSYEKGWDFAHKVIYSDNNLNSLKELAKVVAESGKGQANKNLAGFDSFVAGLKNVNVSSEIKEVADIYLAAKKAMIVFQQNLVTTEAATLIADIALLSGHIGSPRDGILQLKAKNNSQGLIDLGIKDGAEVLAGIKALLVFGEDPKAMGQDLKGLEFLMVSDLSLTETALEANVVIPASSFTAAYGTFTNTEGRLMPVVPSTLPEAELNNWEVASEIARVYEVEFGYECAGDISCEMESVLPYYRNACLGLATTLKPLECQLISVESDSLFINPLKSSDALLNKIEDKLPKATTA